MATNANVLPSTVNSLSIDAPTQQVPGTPAARSQIIALGLGLLVLAFLLVYLFFLMWPVGIDPDTKGNVLRPIYLFGATKPTFEIPLDRQLFLMVMAAGGLGSFIHIATSFGDYVGNEKLTTNWSWWYILRPFIGMTLAVVFYLVIRGGFLSTGTDSGTINPFGIAALSALVGMFSKQATDKLAEVFDTLFKTSSDSGDAKRKDNLLNPEPVITEIEPQSVEPKTENVVVTVKGTGFVQGAVIRVNDVNRETEFNDATQLTAKLLPEDVAEEGELKVTVFNPGPGGGASVPLILKIATSVGGPGPNIPGSNGSVPQGDNAGSSGASPASSLSATPGLAPEPKVTDEPAPPDDDSNLEGCEITVTELTADEELPASRGGIG